MGVLGLDGLLINLLSSMKNGESVKPEETDETEEIEENEEGFTQPSEAESWGIIAAIIIIRLVLIYLFVPFAWNSSIAPAISGSKINGLQALGFALFLEMLI
tara:strand:+ start:631 stop:936 length:306 start_codon:yes stop_codon:yes gene_type:complete